MLQRIHHPEEEEEQEEEEARIPTMGMGRRRFGGMPQGGKDPKEAVAETRQQGGEGEVTSSSVSVLCRPPLAVPLLLFWLPEPFL